MKFYSVPEKHFLEVPPFFKGGQGDLSVGILKIFFWNTIEESVTS